VNTIIYAGGGTGGHLMPALAIAQAMAVVHPEIEAFFAGAVRGIEARVLPERQLAHRLFPFQPIFRERPWRNASWPLLAWRLVREVDNLLDDIRPVCVIGTGGYVSAPVVWRAARRGIPTGILELDVRPGLATRALARSVREIWLGAPEALIGIPEGARAKAAFTGAPIARPDASRVEGARRRFGIVDATRPVLVVTGGSQGSLAINRLVAEWLDAGGGTSAHVIWATGRATHEQFAHLHAPPAVHVVPFLDPMADAWAVASLCVARAGMMTIAELCAWGIASILIPLPNSASDHQAHNAQALAASGGAVALAQVGLTFEHFRQVVDQLLGDAERRHEVATRALVRGRPQAASDIAARVFQLATS